MFGSSSGQRLAAPPELPLAEEGGTRAPLREELQALHKRLDQLFEEVAGVRREVAQRETEYQALMEALARMATAMSVNTAMLEELDERLPSVLLRRN
jgi:septal ring factor EnvC (AmiA/AmiB activator)